jgi:uncharacterized protein (TIGR03545 family)
VRKKGVILLFILLAIVIAANILLTDRWLEKQIENAGSSAVGAKVELRNFDFSLLGMRVKWDSLEVADPNDGWKDAFATGRCEFDMRFLPLLTRKVIIDDIKVSDVRTGIKRSTDGSLPPKKKSASTEPSWVEKQFKSLKTEVSAAPAWNLNLKQQMNLDSLMRILDIRSPRMLDSLKTSLEARYAAWDSWIAAGRIQKESRALDSLVGSIDTEKLKTLADLQQTLTTLKAVQSKVDTLRNFAGRTKTDFTNDLESSKTVLADAKSWIGADYDRVLAQAKLPEFSKEKIGRWVFGPKITGQVERVLAWNEKIRFYLAKFKSDKPKKEPKPPRLHGQDIYFPHRELPDFWIKQIHLSGWTPDEIKLSGTMTDVTSQQKLVGRPTKLDLGGVRDDGASISLDGEWNDLGPTLKQTYRLALSGIPMQNARIIESKGLSAKFSRGKGKVEANLLFDQSLVESRVSFTAENTAFDFDSTSSGVASIVRTLLDGLNEVKFTAAIRAVPGNTDFSMDSNLDEYFRDRVKTLASAEVEKAKAKLMAEVDKRVEPYKQALFAKAEAKRAELEKKLAEVQDLAASKLKMFDDKKKEIEARIEQEKNKKTGEIQKGVQKELDNLFKKKK